MDQRTYPFLILASHQDVSTISQAEASKPLQLKKMQECNRCKAAGFPNQFIGFEKVGKHSTTGKISGKLIDENGVVHKHKFVQDLPIDKTPAPTSFRCRRVVGVAAVTEVGEARNWLRQVRNIKHRILRQSLI